MVQMVLEEDKVSQHYCTPIHVLGILSATEEILSLNAYSHPLSSNNIIPFYR